MTQRQVPQVQTVPNPSINQVTKHADIPQKQYIDIAAAVPIVIQRQVPRIQTVSKTVKVPPAQFVGTVVNVHVIKQLVPRQAPQAQTVETVEVRPLPFIGRILETCHASATDRRARPKSEILAEVCISLNGLTQATMIQLCCRATRTSSRRPAKDRGLLWSLCRPVISLQRTPLPR